MRLCIDPGHGGRDVGAVGLGGLQEATINLHAALQLRSMLVSHGHEVVLTRATPQALSEHKATDLRMRAALANREKCNLFISIHCNSDADPTEGGSETWYHPKSKVNATVAGIIQNTLVTAGQLQDRGTKASTSQTVLRYVEMPAVLIELAFISNPAEAKLLGGGWWVSRVMSAISTELSAPVVVA